LTFLLAATTNKGALANVFGALSCLARPDSLLLVAPILLMGRETRRLRNLAWFVGIGLLWESFALLYYRELVPNSYHAKIGLTRFGPFLKDALKTITGLTFSEQLGWAREPSAIQRGIVSCL
jgi:Gpi18-like mannosyltransferase